ncbi:MAG: YceI family protein [Acidobacteriota bacterium]
MKTLPIHKPAALLAAAVLIAVAFAAPASAATTRTYAIDPAHSEASFQIRHMFTQVRGEFNDFEGTIRMDPESPAESTVRFRIEAASIDTDNADRDKHLRSEDFFWVEKHPVITFESESIRPVGEGRYAVTGTLTMRGVSKRVTLPVEMLGVGTDPWGNTRAGFSAETRLNRKEYDINWNQALDQGGYILGDEVDIEIHVEAVEQKPETEAATGAAD